MLQTRSIQTKSIIIQVLLILTIVSTLILVFSFVKSNLKENVTTRAMMDLQSTGNTQSDHLFSIIDQQYDVLRFLSNYTKNKEDFAAEKNKKMLVSLVETNEICMLGFADVNGDAIGFDGVDLGNISSRKYFSSVANSYKKSYIEYLGDTILTSEPRVLLSVPVYDESMFRGVLFVAKEVQIIENALFTDPNFNSSTRIYIVNSDFEILFANPEGYKNEDGTTLSHYHNDKGLVDITEDQLLGIMSNGQSGCFSYQPDTHDSSIEYVSVTSVGINDWYLFCIVNRDSVINAYSTIYANTNKIITVVCIAYSLVLIAMFVILAIEIKEKIKISHELEGDKEYVSEALTSAFTLCLSIDLTNNTYNQLGQNSLLTRERRDKGSFDELIDIITNSIPDTASKESFKAIFDRQSLLEAYGRGEKMISQRHKKNEQDGQEHWVDTIVVFIQGAKNVRGVLLSQNVDEDQARQDEIQDISQLANIYREALLSDTCAMMEVDLSSGIITKGPYEIENGKKTRLLIDANETKEYDAYERRIIEHNLVSDDSDFYQFSNRNYLIKHFEEGHKYSELSCCVNWPGKGKRDLRISYSMSRNVRNAIIVAFCTVYDVSDLVKRKQELKDLKSALEDIRISVSANQMRPHFLYNALGSIREIILEDPQYASDLICDFTTHLRACVRMLSTGDLIPFSSELENVKAYVNIEKMRFGDKLQIEYDIQTEMFDIIPLGVQPIVENAIRHGIFPKGKAGGTVKLITRDTKEKYVIIVSDNGVGFDYESVQNEVLSGIRDSTGLANMKFRFEKRQNATVIIDSKVGIGTTVTISIPKVPERETTNESNNS